MNCSRRSAALWAALAVCGSSIEVAAQHDEPSEHLVAEHSPGEDPHANERISLDLALILDVAGAWFSVEEPQQLGAHDPAATGFTFQQLELSAGAVVDRYLRFDANLVFSPSGVEIEEAYASSLTLPAGLKARVGQFLTRIGRSNATHPHTWNFVDLPLVNGTFLGPEGSRGVGAEMSWLAPLPWHAELAGSATMAPVDVTVRTPADLLYTTRLEQLFHLGESLSASWGLSAQFGPNATGAGNQTEIYETDLYLRWRPTHGGHTGASLQLEGMFRTQQIPDDVAQDLGGRAELVVTLTERWETGARYGVLTATDRHRVAAQLTFHPSHFSRIRLQQSLDLPSELDVPIHATMLNFQVLVGAHAHHD